MTRNDLVSTDWLADHLGDPGVVVLHASYFLGLPGWSPEASYGRGHIPGARLYDIDLISDAASPLPHMMPDEKTFSDAVGALGISNDHTVVIYDDGGVRPSFRVWFTFKVFGHDKVAVLDGGLQKWVLEKRPVTTDMAEIWAKSYAGHFDASRVKALQDLLDNLETGEAQVVDARGPGRFTGSEEEPRPGLRSGHIPGSRNLYYASLFNIDGTLKSKDELTALVQRAGLTKDKPVITTCGSGMTACILNFVLHMTGFEKTALYDGSWVEWGMAKNTPVETGEAGP